MAERIYLNNEWKFGNNCLAEDKAMMDVRIPHTCMETPFNCFDEKIYQMVCIYKRTITAPKEWEGQSVVITFEGVAHACEVFLNGEIIGKHNCGYTGFSIEIDEVLKYGNDNLLTVRVDSREELNIPPFGYVIDYMTYGGIYRDVYLEVRNLNHIEDIFLRSTVDVDNNKAELLTDISITGKDKNVYVRQYIKEIQEKNYTELIINGHLNIKALVEDVELWSVDNPKLYEIRTELWNEIGLLDYRVDKFGFRKAEFKQDGFYLNDKKLKIRGLNRHQSYPYVGYAMPKSIQVMDADILKYELGLNAVRTSHYPQSHDFINRCDEIGLLVFTEIPGWQHIGDESWKEQAIINTGEMVLQYRNHTSIILWGVRINESGDDDEFYRRTNEMARSLDNTRATGGVRAHKKSSLLEDVYTYNDFSHSGKNEGCEKKKKVTSDKSKAYLITEYNGHMFPTKNYDCEEHRMEHAIRHANVLNAVAGRDDVAGSFGWCMADYNTHKDFGSGDRICYHGVMDMFRNPKMAADIYACQQEDIPVLSISSSMDIGEHPACNRDKTWIFSNADSVKMYKNNRFIKEYTSKNSSYENLLHGPILIDDYVGNAVHEGEKFKPKQADMVKEMLNAVALNGLSNMPKKMYLNAAKLVLGYGMKVTEAVGLYNKYIGDWGGTSTVYKFEAIKDGEVVSTLIKEPMKKVKIETKTNSTKLIEGKSYDVAAVRIRAVDEHDNVLPFYQEPLVLETEGPIEIIGDGIISLKGGMGGTYVRTLGTSGVGILRIKGGHIEEKEIRFTVEVV